MLHRSIMAALGRCFEKELEVMAWSERFPGAVNAEERAERAMRLPLGAISPLWPIFGAAAGAGLAYWWLTRWPRALNFEAMAGLAGTPARKPRRNEILPEPATSRAPLRIAEPSPGPAAQPEAPARADEAQPVLRQLFPEAKDELAQAAKENKTAAAAGEAVGSDDLTRIFGIGPRLAAALGERGVSRFSQIAAWTAKDLAEVDAALNLRGRAARDGWVDQARKFAAEA
jgi:predicted flap endonuclease-1-like 5' DNA nuclease